MSKRVDDLLAKLKKEREAAQEKEKNMDDPVSMAVSEDDADMELDLDSDVSDGEYTEDYFNEDADISDDASEEPEDDAVTERAEPTHKEKKKDKKKQAQEYENEYENEEYYDPLDDLSEPKFPDVNADPYAESEVVTETLITDQSTAPAESEHYAENVIDAVVEEVTADEAVTSTDTIAEAEPEAPIETSAADLSAALVCPEMEQTDAVNVIAETEAAELIDAVVEEVTANEAVALTETVTQEDAITEERASDLSDTPETEKDVVDAITEAEPEDIISTVIEDAAADEPVISYAADPMMEAAADDPVPDVGLQADVTDVTDTAPEADAADLIDTVIEDAAVDEVVVAETSAETAALIPEADAVSLPETVTQSENYAGNVIDRVVEEVTADEAVTSTDTIAEAEPEHVPEVGTADSPAAFAESVVPTQPVIDDAGTLLHADVISDGIADPVHTNHASLIDHVVEEAGMEEARPFSDGVDYRSYQEAAEYQITENGNADATQPQSPREAVADMLRDDQIHHPTEAYFPTEAEYRQDFSCAEQSVAKSTSDDQKLQNADLKVFKNSNQEFTGSPQERGSIDATNDTKTKTKDAADDSKEQAAAEKKPPEWKEHTLHHFTEVANAAVRQLEIGGRKVVMGITDTIKNADPNVKKDRENVEKLAKIVAESAAIMGMAALAGSYSDQMRSIGQAGEKVDKLIAAGKLTASDLRLSKSKLDQTLKEAGVSHADRAAVIKNRKDIHDMIGVRSEMQSMAATGQIRVSEKDNKVLHSSQFYDLRNKEMGSLLQLYYKNSSDDTIRNVFGNGNFTTKSSASFRKFIRKMDKNEVSVNGRAAIRMGQKAALRAGSNRELYGHLRMKLMGTAILMKRNVTSYDKNTRAGSKSAQAFLYMGLRSTAISKKVLIGTRAHGYRGLAVSSMRVVKKIVVGTKKNGYKGILTQLGRSAIRFSKYADKMAYQKLGYSVGASYNQLRKGKAQLVEQIKKNGEIAKKKAIAATIKAKKAALNTEAGKRAMALHTHSVNATNAIAAKYRQTEKATRAAAQKIAQTKAAKAAAATGNAVAKGANLFIGTPLHFGVGAFRKVKAVFGKAFNAINKIKKLLCGAIFMFCIIYAALVPIVGALLNLINTDSAAVMSILLPDRDAFVTESIDRYLQKSDDIKNDAIRVGEGTPLTTLVTNGHTISRYGHPDENGDWVQGYKIYYTDSAGNIIQDGSNNVKDTLILAYVQMDAEWRAQNEAHATDLMDKYFRWLNPNSDHQTLLANSEESDIYFCSGCETVYYTCNSDALVTDTSRPYLKLSSVLAQRNNGAKFSGNIIQNTNGDYYVTKCKIHLKYGPDGHGGRKVIGRTNHGSAVNRAPSRCYNYKTTRYCTGHKIKVCYGHRDITIKIPIKTMQDAFNENYMVYDHAFNQLNGSWTEDATDWCNSLYDADWYDLYGKDPSGGIGFTPGSTMSPEDVDKVLKNCGDVSAIRKKIISSAMSQVGSLPYYYGGKPTSGGTPIQTNHGTAGAKTNVADHIGRTTAGLDCFGFCQWAYWNATGSNILPEGSAYTTTTVYNSQQCGNLKRLSGAGELKVGDLGFLAGHVGIFAGVSDSGQLMWLHCNGSANTVSYGPYNGFTRFYRLSGLN